MFIRGESVGSHIKNKALEKYKDFGSGSVQERVSLVTDIQAWCNKRHIKQVKVRTTDLQYRDVTNIRTM